MKYLLDTNHVGLAVRPESPVARRMREVRWEGHALGTCIPVLREIEAGLLQVRNPAAYRHQLERVLRVVRVWPLDRPCARGYGRLYNELRARGRVLSQVDLMVAALAEQLNATLITTDRDFEAVESLRVEDWSR